MGVRNLDKIFRPERIALIGVNDAPSDAGFTVLRNLINSGYRGVVYTISPDRESIRGIPTYPTLASLPKTPDLAVICSPPQTVPDVVQQCGAAGICGLVILSGGFRESGEEGRARERQIAEVASQFDHLRIIGPNSLGIVAPAIGLNASQAGTLPKAGHLAFVSGSRGLCNSVIDWAAEQGIGFSYFVCIGNKLDVGFGDLIDYFGADPKTRAIILYVHSIQHARRFMSAARAFARTKPIVVYKAGRFEQSAQAAASHTGSLVGEDAVYEAAFVRAGVVRVAELDDIFHVAELLASQRLPQGQRLAIVSNAGGPAIIAADALLAHGGDLVTLSDETSARLGEALPPEASHGNPVDLSDNAAPQTFAKALAVVVEDGGVDAVLVIFANQSESDPSATARVVAEVAQQSRKPILAAWMSGERVREGIQILNDAGLSTHATPEQAVRAFMHLVAYARNLDALYETPRDMPIRFKFNRHKLRKKLRPLLMAQPGALSESQGECLLRAYEIPVAHSVTAHSRDKAVEAAARIGYPVVLKVLSPQIFHKVDVGGVALDLKDRGEVEGAYERIVRVAKAHRMDAEVKGVIVQKMVKANNAVELILGAKKDPTFGPVTMVGLGGIATGVFRDHALGLPPLNERLARRMLESLRSWPMLKGYRGRPPANLERLIEIMIRFSFLVADYPEIREFDINPLLVTGDDVVALDAAAIIEVGLKEQPAGHSLAIRPYPEEYSRRCLLKDRTPVVLRSIRPEDEPSWHKLIARSSAESIRFRFRSMFQRMTHKMAVQYCVIDYEREIAIVAEAEADGKRELIGLGGLAADAEHEMAEFAVLVPDPWQGKGLGGMLLDHCLELASRWGIRRVVAETDLENHRMRDLFRSRGFEARIDREEEIVWLEKTLDTTQRRSREVA